MFVYVNIYIYTFCIYIHINIYVLYIYMYCIYIHNICIYTYNTYMYIYIMDYNGSIVLSFVCLTGWFCRGRDYQVARIKPFISFLGRLGQALVSFWMTIRAETHCWPWVYQRNLKWNNIKRLIKRQQPSILECSNTLCNTHYFEWDNHTQHNDHSSLNVYIDEPILEPISGGRSKSTVTLAEFHNWCPNVSWKGLAVRTQWHFTFCRFPP